MTRIHAFHRSHTHLRQQRGLAENFLQHQLGAAYDISVAVNSSL